MPKTLVLFYSRTGHTARLAEAIADGARAVRFSEVDVRRLDDLEPPAIADDALRAEHDRIASAYRPLDDVEELTGYDALVLGAPARYGILAPELARFLDRTGPLLQRNALADRVGSAFTTGATPHGGHELTLWSIMMPMATLGMLLVPPGYTDPVMRAGGTPYGATATTGTSGTGISEPTGADLAAARHQGKRVATVAEWVRHAKSHAPHHHHH